MLPLHYQFDVCYNRCMTDDYPEVPAKNLALIQAMADAGMTKAALAKKVGVTPVTVRRWTDGVASPYEANANDAAKALGKSKSELWPTQWPNLSPPSTGTVPLSAYSARSDVPQTVWVKNFRDALRNVDVLVYGGTFLFDSVKGFPDALQHAATQGARIRVLIGDPDGVQVPIRGQEEQLGSSLTGRCRMAIKHFSSLQIDNLEIRLHDTPLYTSLFRTDDTLIANPHVLGRPASNNPCLVIDARDHSGLWDTYSHLFERVWATATLHHRR